MVISRDEEAGSRCVALCYVVIGCVGLRVCVGGGRHVSMEVFFSFLVDG